MQPTTMAAIYFILWFLSLFLVLPFGVRTADEAGIAKIPGQADSAPVDFNLWRTVRRTSVVAAILFALFYFNYVNGWVTVRSFDWLFSPPDSVLN